MNKKMNKLLYLIIPIIFIIVEGILYSFYIFRYTNLSIDSIDYCIIITATFFSLIYFNKSKDSRYTALALLFTAVSDLILIFYLKIQNVGLMTFNFVQIFYALRMSHSFKKISPKWNLIIRLCLIFIVEIVARVLIGDAFDLTIFLTAAYFTNLCLNFILSFIKIKETYIITIALFLFILCDICVGLYNSSNYFPLPNFIAEVIYNAPFSLEWFFYIPSQVLLALSTLITIKKKISLDKIEQN